MTPSPLFTAIRDILVEHHDFEPSDITLDSHLTNDLDLDDLARIEVLLACEERFEIDIPEDDAEEFATVGEIVAYLEKRGVRA